MLQVNYNMEILDDAIVFISRKIYLHRLSKKGLFDPFILYLNHDIFLSDEFFITNEKWLNFHHKSLGFAVK